MREVKFRGKAIQNESIKVGDWAYGNLCTLNGFRIRFGSFRQPQVDPETIGEFTGLIDQNGVEIYEGDILMFDSTESDYKPKSEVSYNKEKCCFYFGNMPIVNLMESGYYQPNIGHSAFVVVGNIHDNKSKEKIKEKISTDAVSE